jgi:hypothetical protein
VVDKRITSRWLVYERLDTALGAMLFVACAAAVLILSATASSGTSLSGHFSDAGAVARAIEAHLGATAGALFAIALLNASLLGAGVVSLSGSYAVAEVFGVKHSLHRSWRDARAFHASFALLVALAAGVVVLVHLPLGAITTLVQALAGILLPSTAVLLLILCNDDELLGPLTNGRWLNLAAGFAVAVVLALSTVLAITTTVPGLPTTPAFIATLAPLSLGAAVLSLRSRRGQDGGGGLTPWQRQTWSAPMLERLRPPARSRPRLVVLGALRVYVLAIALLLALRLTGVLPT